MAELLRNRVPSLGLSLGFILALGCVDYRTALELDLFLFYALPLGIATCPGEDPLLPACASHLSSVGLVLFLPIPRLSPSSRLREERWPMRMRTWNALNGPTMNAEPGAVTWAVAARTDRPIEGGDRHA
jgi:hypothetical protein